VAVDRDEYVPASGMMITGAGVAAASPLVFILFPRSVQPFVSYSREKTDFSVITYMFSSGGQSFRASLIPDQRSIQIFGIFKKTPARYVRSRQDNVFSSRR
jgi:hypothetical protein